MRTSAARCGCPAPSAARYSRAVAGTCAKSGPGRGTRSRTRPTRFAPHWEREQLQRALKAGGAFRAALRFSAADRSQAFATLAGLRSDVMVRVRRPRAALPERAAPRGCPRRRCAAPGGLAALRACSGGAAVVPARPKTSAPRWAALRGRDQGTLPRAGCPAGTCRTGLGVAHLCGRLAARVLQPQRARTLYASASPSASCAWPDGVRCAGQGALAQNRAVEGDAVALRLLPLPQWFELRGGGGGGGGGGSARVRPGASPSGAGAGGATRDPETLGACGGAGAQDPASTSGPVICRTEGQCAAAGGAQAVSALSQSMQALRAGAGPPAGSSGGQAIAGAAREAAAPGAGSAGAAPESCRQAHAGSLSSEALNARVGGDAHGGSPAPGSSPGALPGPGASPSPSLSGAASADSTAVCPGSPRSLASGLSMRGSAASDAASTEAASVGSGATGGAEDAEGAMRDADAAPGATAAGGEGGAGARGAGSWSAAKAAARHADAPWERASTPDEALRIVAALCAACQPPHRLGRGLVCCG
jgi:hypothetical protein